MPSEVLKTLLECGVHFGHQTRRWNPKMKRFIFGERSGIYIIDLEKTKDCLDRARDFVRDTAAKGGSLLFVGTKKQAKEVIPPAAEQCGMFFITNRWMGGLLTNFETVKKSIDKLERIEKMEEEGIFQNLTKKEVAGLRKEKEKLLRDLGGIREMKKLPAAIFIVDSKREEIAVKEANRLKIPIIGLIDTNCDPDRIDYPVPGNDDALKSIRHITSVIADAAAEGRKEYLEAETLRKKAQEEKQAKATKAKKEEAAKEETGEAQAVVSEEKSA